MPAFSRTRHAFDSARLIAHLDMDAFCIGQLLRYPASPAGRS
jgi:hypothetical protein